MCSSRPTYSIRVVTFKNRYLFANIIRKISFYWFQWYPWYDARMFLGCAVYAHFLSFRTYFIEKNLLNDKKSWILNVNCMPQKHPSVISRIPLEPEERDLSYDARKKIPIFKCYNPTASGLILSRKYSPSYS